MALALVFRTVIDDLQAIAPEKAVSLLGALLRHSDGEVRFPAAKFMLRLEGDLGIPSVLPLFNDPLDWIRWSVVPEISKYADESVIDPLISVLKTDPDPGVRGQAAHALGCIGSPQAIPALISAIEQDKQEDALGHTPSSISATALDNILGTNETRIDMGDGFCKMAPWPADHEFLKRQALKLWETWQASKMS